MKNTLFLKIKDSLYPIGLRKDICSSMAYWITYHINREQLVKLVAILQKILLIE